MATQNRRNIDLERLERARETLCNVFGISALREHQERAGRNIIQGLSTIYDVPTGGGKTLAFWYPLFYYWKPGDEEPASQKVVLVGIPAIAVNSSGHAKELFEEPHTDGSAESRLKYRVILPPRKQR
ncbi:hypothetical protein VKT23_000190 [Stygiomarasmius scandens]|uniref:DEAD/DEAH-box helicase domain-containing protein n=1 Tax=Marasmiellus scandens TaxID=2682957 RepID=A0ABR1K5X8_9AGAR